MPCWNRTIRGSTGYGDAHYKAGWKQWGLKMQDDIADGARWAIAKGHADPQRICIAGASYGGYSTLMGLVNDPDLFKCGINWVGVTDINMMRDGHWTGDSDLSDVLQQIRHERHGGRPRRRRRAAESHLAGRTRRPASSSHCCSATAVPTRRVPISHGRAFHDAVSKTNSAMSNGWSTRKKAMAGRCRKTISTSGRVPRNYYSAA